MSSTRIAFGVALACTLTSIQPGFAQPAPKPKPTPSAAPAPAAEDPKKEQAREHFERGISLIAEEGWDAALAEFMLSRELARGRAATKNAAVCLRKLHRYDEALEMFEALLKDFSDLSADDKRFAEKSMGELKLVVGFLDIKGTAPGATLSIDGRDRGEFKPGSPVRVGAGSRIVRLYKQGFAPIEKRVEVSGEQTVVVDATMAALTRSGRLKVTEKDGKAVDVVVDSVIVGKTPWEGEMTPGEHSVVLRGEGDVGSPPVSAPVRVNEVTPLTLAAEALDASVRIEPTPPGASVALDGVSLGRGLWEGRLKSGPHDVEVGAEGFLASKRSVTLGRDVRNVVAIKLERDPSSPLWGAKNHGRFVVELVGGTPLAPSFGGSAAGACDSPCSRGLGFGFLGQLHVAYELESGVLLGLSGGYLTASQRVTGRASSIAPKLKPVNPGTLEDALRLSGLTVGVTGGWHSRGSFPVVTLRLGAGALIGSMKDDRHGAFTSSAGTAYQEDVSDAPKATYFYLAPEVRVGVRLIDRFELSLGAQGVVLLALSKPVTNTRFETDVPNDGRVTFGFQQDEVVAGGAMFLIVPNLALRADF